MFFEQYRRELLQSKAAALSAAAMPRMDKLTPDQQLMQLSLIALQQEMDTKSFSAMLAQHPRDDQMLHLALIKDWHDKQSVLSTSMHHSSVLDSGSSRHIHPRAQVLDADSTVPITGFDNSVQWTKGSGYLPLEVNDQHSGTTRKLDVTDVDTLNDDQINQPIMSLGKLLRAGWTFHFADNGGDCHAITPDGATKVQVELGTDDILRLPHKLRTGDDADQLPCSLSQVNHADVSNSEHKALIVKRKVDKATAGFLHDLFYHSSADRIFHTLEHTIGYEAVRLPPHQCDTCAEANARRRGLSHKATLAMLGLSCLNTSDQLVEADYNDHEYDDDSDHEGGALTELNYTAPTAGRQLGTGPVPRFELDTLRPFEIMFADNKDYPCPQYGGDKIAFLLIDLKTRAKFKIDVRRKSENGDAFAKIMALNGVHKLGYHCTIYTDGCGSMAHVATAAMRMGINHQYTPPYEPNLNEAEKVCDRMFAAARVMLLHTGQHQRYMCKAVDAAMYIDLRMATNAARGHLTPYEMIKGQPPNILHMRPFNSKVLVTVPKAKRQKLITAGQPLVRAEAGRLMGWQSPWSNTPCILLDSGAMIHSINVTYDLESYRLLPTQDTAMIDDDSAIATIEYIPAQGKEALPAPAAVDTRLIEYDSDNDDHISSPTLEPITSNIEDITNAPRDLHTDSEFQGLADERDATPQQRPRPTYFNEQASFLCNLSRLVNLTINGEISKAEEASLLDKLCLQISKPTNENIRTHLQAAHYLACIAQKDMSWKTVLAGPDRDKAIKALHKEMDSLLSTILTEVTPVDADYDDAVNLATPGRLLLDIKRDGSYKARGVKQGFKEDKVQADGPDFSYYSHVAKLTTVRMTVLRQDRGNRRLAAIDIATAFLQSHSYPDGTVKYVVFTDPITGAKRYYRQSGPIYGEASAPVRWEDTLAPWLVNELGFIRGDNEPCVFYHPERDLLVITYVDDVMLDGYDEDINWFHNCISGRFDCKDLTYLSAGSSIDYIGMDLIMDSTRIYISMARYIGNMLNLFDMANSKPASTPIDKPIDTDSPALPAAQRRQFMTGLGMLGWLVNTARPDLAYAHSRIAQHAANPTEASWHALMHVMRYCRGAAHWCLSVKLNRDDMDVNKIIGDWQPKHDDWECYSDSDLGGNAEIQNKRRSQNGAIIMRGGAPQYWHSKVSSVAFAHADIGEAHADIASAAAEVYAASNATHEMLHFSYVVEEAGMTFPLPARLLIDNTAAIIFADNSCFKSKLKHIDCRQEWVKTLRDKNIIVPAYVSTNENVADIFTKILSTQTFTYLRDKIMFEYYHM